MHTELNDNREPGYFPFEYVVDFLRFLRRHKRVIKIITYADLPWEDDLDYENNYPLELRNWKKNVENGAISSRKIFVLLQHDVDSASERTMALLREEERLVIPSNVMIFNRRINRKHLEATGELLSTDYPLDYEYLCHLQDSKRFVIGYHCNTFERALFDREKAIGIFEEDVRMLRSHFNIRFFSPHGGARSPEGLSNNCLQIPESFKNSLRWVHNKKTVRFDGQYSDGGLNSPQRDPLNRDLRDFVRTWKRGKRYRVLIHPEYYHTPWTPSPQLTGTPWYDDLLNFYSSGRNCSTWNKVRLARSESFFRKKLRELIKGIKRRRFADK